MAEMKRANDKYNQEMRATRDYVIAHGISTALSMRMKRYIERQHERKKQVQNEAALKELLSSELLRDVLHQAE